MEKLRAVIYNRCSTEEESQKDALIKQVQESKRCVHEQGWELVDAYAEHKRLVSVPRPDAEEPEAPLYVPGTQVLYAG